MKSAVRISHLSKNFGEQVVLNDVSLELQEGQILLPALYASEHCLYAITRHLLDQLLFKRVMKRQISRRIQKALIEQQLRKIECLPSHLHQHLKRLKAGGENECGAHAHYEG